MYDGDRLLSSQPEPEWDERQQDWMVALNVYESMLCPKCGGPISECTAPENEFKYKTGLPTRCHRTTSQLIAADKAAGAAHSKALMFGTEKID